MGRKKINTKVLFETLKNKEALNKKAGENKEISKEIDKVSFNLSLHMKELDTEKAIKKILWEGVLNQFGTFGTKSGHIKSFQKKGNNGEQTIFDYNKQFSKGKMVSIDFGTSNIDRELSLTHTGIVLADYTGLMVVVPITSQTSMEFNNLAEDIQNDVIPIYSRDYSQVENDSYILMHQIRTVSKNRITKNGIVGSLAGTHIMKEIENKLLKMMLFDYYEEQQSKIESLEKEIEMLKLQLTSNV
ncbi:type II toxin-antitoxin system PemK/MazF family toxin [Bacillus infantis]|uniref:type II toxin-antitoxin system PemK/MazF family toxin n=1 Tax=Bacillus infantis TaxID=324767 RepID=UPI003CE8E401